MTSAFLLVLLSSLLGVSGQICLKLGMERLGILNLSGLDTVLQTSFHIFSTPLVLAGLGCYGVATVIWLLVLSRLDVSLAYPLLALNFVFVPLAAWLILGESIPSWRWVGVGVIIVGVTIIART